MRILQKVFRHDIKLYPTNIMITRTSRLMFATTPEYAGIGARELILRFIKEDVSSSLRTLPKTSGSVG